MREAYRLKQVRDWLAVMLRVMRKLKTNEKGALKNE